MYRRHTRRALADLRDRLVPVGVQVGAPGRQGPGVVLTQVLLVPHLEASVVHERDQVPGSLELPVGEHVPVDEPAHADGRLVLSGRVMQWLSSRPPGFSCRNG